MSDTERLISELASLDWELMALLATCSRSALYRDMGYRSFHEFIEMGLGLSPREVHGMLELEKRLFFLPRLTRAFRAGQLS